MEPSINMRDKMEAEQAIRALEAVYDAAWNRGDVEGILACFTEDALIVDPRGGVTRGREEIRRLLASIISPGSGDTTHHAEIVRVEFLTPEVALVDGWAHISGLPEAQVAKTLVHRFTDVVVCRDGLWRIAQIRACPLEPDTLGDAL